MRKSIYVRCFVCCLYCFNFLQNTSIKLDQTISIILTNYRYLAKINICIVLFTALQRRILSQLLYFKIYVFVPFNCSVVDHDVVVTYFLSYRYRLMGGLCPGHVQPGSFLLLYFDGDRISPVLLGIQKEKEAALWVRRHWASSRSEKLNLAWSESLIAL